MMRKFQEYPFVPERHEARLPELVDGTERRRHPVVIVGGGIVGLTSALALARYGVPSVVLESDQTVCIGSRAICVSRRSLEILARYGAVDPFLAKGLPWTGGRSFYREAEVLRFSMPHDENQRLPPMLNIQQYYIEQFLLAAARNSELVDIRWGSRLEAIAQADHDVVLSVNTTSASYRMRADWVIGCDGARSAVRDAARLTLQGTSYEGRYVIVDIALRSSRPTERLAWFDPPSNPGSTILMHRQPDDVWRIDYQLRDDEDAAAAVLPEEVIPRVSSHLHMIGERDDWAPIWISLYKANALTLNTYRSGRILLAGDAAHLVPIFGVRGANSAFEDADNLAWKLALVVRGAAGEHLLDSYSAERVHAARENIRQGTKSTEFMSPPSYGFELMRTAVLGLAVNHAFLRPLINPRQTQAIAYSRSPLNGPSVGPFAAGPPPGSVAQECPLTLSSGSPGHVTNLLEPCFTALCFTDSGAANQEFTAVAHSCARKGLSLRVVAVARERPSSAAQWVAWDHTARVFAIYGAVSGTVYLFRPDGHVLARWRRATPDQLLSVLENTLNTAAPVQEEYAQ